MSRILQVNFGYQINDTSHLKVRVIFADARLHGIQLRQRTST